MGVQILLGPFYLKMQLGKKLYITNGKDWRLWLKRNHNKEKEIWLIYYRKSSGKKRIYYNDAVNEALCYGWIDSTIKGIDEEKFAQRFTARRKGSKLSEMNRERVRRLIKQGRMTSVGLDAINHVFNQLEDKKLKLVIAKDIIISLKKDNLVWKNFQNFSEGYRKVRIGYLEGRRKWGKIAFDKSLNYLIKMTAKNKKFGLVH